MRSKKIKNFKQILLKFYFKHKLVISISILLFTSIFVFIFVYFLTNSFELTALIVSVYGYIIPYIIHSQSYALNKKNYELKKKEIDLKEKELELKLKKLEDASENNE